MMHRIKGTQDILDVTLYNFLLSSLRRHLTCHHFSEIITPILEPLELFKRSLGVATDVVSKEMYTISTGYESDEQICLRPEATASTIRAFYNNGIQETPWKVFSVGPMFRHERPQKGRLRQFTQASIEMVGTNGFANDALFITMLDRFFHETLKLDNYALLINYLGCADDRARHKQALHAFLEEHIAEICPQCKERKDKNTLRVFDCKTPTCQELYTKAPQITDYLCTLCNYEWEQLQMLLKQLSISFSHNPHLVRGLDYYQKTVFEFVSLSLGAQSTFCGGGRYDGLAQALGEEKPLPAIGAAIGIERMLLMLTELQDRLPLPHKPALQVIMPLTKDQYAVALLLADTLHHAGLCVDIFLEGNSLKSMMRTANKMGAQHALIIGSDEQAAHQVTVKNMTTGTETRVAQQEVAKILSS